MKKKRFSVDNNNRLVINQDDRIFQPKGVFAIDESNRLIYWLNESPAWRKRYQFPEKIVFTGNWALDSNYDLELKLEQDKSEKYSDKLLIKGEIVSCESDKLVFEIKSIDNDGITQLMLLKLTGVWQANEYNQISFLVSNKVSPDVFTFKGNWQLNQNQQITYTYEKSDLKRKTKYSSELTFRGFWEISSANQLTYIISKGAESKFDFKVQMETPNIYPKKGVIKYRLGIGAKELRGDKTKIISLYGVWNFSRKLGLNFDMQYGKGKIHSLTFGAQVIFNKKNQVIFNLTNEFGRKLGISVVFNHKFLKQLDAEFFLRLKQLQRESGIDAGIRIPF